MKMRRFIALLMIMSLLWSMANADISAAQIFDAAADLLTDTSNVTLTGSATFSLDGEPFKFVETTYVQDGVNSKWVLNLSSPRADGSMRENGFTAIANNRYKYGIEVFQPGVYRVAEDDPQSVILRPSAELSQLTSMGHGLMELIPAWPEDVFSYTEGGQLHVRLEEEQIPDSVSNLISLAVLLAVQRTTNIVDDSIAVPPYPEEANAMTDYITPTQGIICCTEKYELTEVSVDAKLDEENRFTEANGTVRFTLHTFLEGEHDLHIAFAGTASDYGSSTVPAFDAAEYGVVPAEGAYIPQSEGLSEKEDGRAHQRSDFSGPSIPSHDPRVKPEDMEAWETQLWEKAGYDPEKLLHSETAHCWFAEDGTLLELQDETAPWLEDLSTAEWFDEFPEAESEAVKPLREFLQFANPGMGKDFNFRMVWKAKIGGATYIQYDMSSPYSDESILFVVKEQPDYQIQYFSCISNG